MARSRSRVGVVLVVVTGVSALACVGGGTSVVSYDSESGCCFYAGGNAGVSDYGTCPDTGVHGGEVCDLDRSESSDRDRDGYTPNSGDCDDWERAVHPEAEEFCDGIDNNCDGNTDESGDYTTERFPDADTDGYGDVTPRDPATTCVYPTADNNLDCDDTNPDIHPAAADPAGDGLDQDCDGDDL